ncbi:tyrosine-type recombinase/integrase [Candidatus Omnitrophota bacterium]
METSIHKPKSASMDEMLTQYAHSLSARFDRRVTVLLYQCPVKELIKFAKEKIKTPKDVTPELLFDFQNYLYSKRDFTYETVKSYILRVKLFFDFIINIGTIEQNPARNLIVLPKPELKDLVSRYYSFSELLSRYINDQRHFVSYSYIHQLDKHLKGFFRYLRITEHNTVYKVTQGIILKYRDHLWTEYERDSREGLVPRSQKDRLRTICRFFRYLHREGLIKEDPAKGHEWESYYKLILEKAENLPKKIDDQKDLSDLEELKIKFLDYERTRGKAKNTLNSYRKGIEIFFDFMKERNISTLAQVEKRLFLDYYPYIHNYKGVRGQEVSLCSKAKYLWSLKAFFRFLAKFDYMAKDPTVDLDAIKEERGLPHCCMNEREVFKLLEMPRPNDPLSIRDKAILEVLFSTGVRVNELCGLNIEDADYAQGLVRIDKAKGGDSFQRLIPIGSVALEYLTRYLREARTILADSDRSALFLSYSGRRLNTEGVLNIVKKYAFEAGIRKPVTPHAFRVTCATMMLKNGADIRYVQEQLGHRRITSTQLYTRLMPVDLKSVHSRCHPRERKVGVQRVA